MSISEKGEPLSPEEYTPQSVSRACAKTWLGNTCRRDWLGKPEITCMSTCEGDFCNCDSRSPPTQMFKDGKTLHEAPKGSEYSANDLLSCRAMAGVPGYNDYVPIDADDDEDKPPTRRRKIPRRFRKPGRNSADALFASRDSTTQSLIISLYLATPYTVFNMYCHLA